MRTNLVLGIIAGLAIASSCSEQHPMRNPPPIPAPAGAAEYKSLVGAPVTPESVWPIPTDVDRSGSIVTKIIRPGIGTATPQMESNHVLGIAYVGYDQQGQIKYHVPLKVQAIDLAPSTWREILMKMKKGEVRRAWIPMPNGHVDIMDFEVQQFVTAAPDGSAINIR